jgi:hypothetical protein
MYLYTTHCLLGSVYVCVYIMYLQLDECICTIFTIDVILILIAHKFCLEYN